MDGFTPLETVHETAETGRVAEESGIDEIEERPEIAELILHRCAVRAMRAVDSSCFSALLCRPRDS